MPVIENDENPLKTIGDPINHPAHYCKEGQLECIKQMELIFGKKAVQKFCLLNCYKYLVRCMDKGKPVEDLQKAKWYLTRFMKMYFGVDPMDYSRDILVTYGYSIEDCIFLAKRFLNDHNENDCMNAFDCINRAIDSLILARLGWSENEKKMVCGCDNHNNVHR